MYSKSEKDVCFSSAVRAKAKRVDIKLFLTGSCRHRFNKCGNSQQKTLQCIVFTKKCTFSSGFIIKSSLGVASEYIAIDPLTNNIADKMKTIIMYNKYIYKLVIKNTSDIEVAKILYLYHGLTLLHFL